MKRTVVLILTLMMTSVVFSQSLLEKFPEVQNTKELIDQNDSLHVILIKNEDFLETMTDGGGQLKGFYDRNGTIRKIEVIVFISHGIQEYDFYLKDELPILIDDRFKQFAWNEETSSFDHSKFDGGFHGTYIFLNGHLKDHISLGHNRFEDDQIDIEETFMAEYGNYLEKIKKRLANKGYSP